MALAATGAFTPLQIATAKNAIQQERVESGAYPLAGVTVTYVPNGASFGIADNFTLQQVQAQMGQVNDHIISDEDAIARLRAQDVEVVPAVAAAAAVAEVAEDDVAPVPPPRRGRAAAAQPVPVAQPPAATEQVVAPAEPALPMPVNTATDYYRGLSPTSVRTGNFSAQEIADVKNAIQEVRGSGIEGLTFNYTVNGAVPQFAEGVPRRQMERLVNQSQNHVILDETAKEILNERRAEVIGRIRRHAKYAAVGALGAVALAGVAVLAINGSFIAAAGAVGSHLDGLLDKPFGSVTSFLEVLGLLLAGDSAGKYVVRKSGAIASGIADAGMSMVRGVGSLKGRITSYYSGGGIGFCGRMSAKVRSACTATKNIGRRALGGLVSLKRRATSSCRSLCGRVNILAYGLKSVAVAGAGYVGRTLWDKKFVIGMLAALMVKQVVSDYLNSGE